MLKRIFFGLIMIAGIGGVLTLDWWTEAAATPNIVAAEGTAVAAWSILGLPLAVLLVGVMAMAFVEMGHLAARLEVLLLPVSGLLGTVILTTMPFWWQFVEPAGPGGTNLLVLLGMIILLIFAEQMIHRRTEDALRRVGCTLLAVLYLGIGGAIVLSMRLNYGVPVLVLFIAAVKCTDIGAYFAGTACGRHKMIPRVSPGKSWEGLAGGLGFGAAASVLIVWAMGIEFMAFWEAAIFGVVVGAAGQFADLCESLLKRSANAKDSGAAIPSFGGVLDIIDSPLLGAPVAYILLAILS